MSSCVTCLLAEVRLPQSASKRLKALKVSCQQGSTIPLQQKRIKILQDPWSGKPAHAQGRWYQALPVLKACECLCNAALLCATDCVGHEQSSTACTGNSMACFCLLHQIDWSIDLGQQSHVMQVHCRALEWTCIPRRILLVTPSAPFGGAPQD